MKIYSFIFSLLLGLTTLILNAYPSFAQTSNDSITEIIILHTNDMHGKIDKMPQLAYYTKMIKKENDNVLLLSAGDLFSGNPVVDQYEKKGYPIIHIMNEVGYDLSTIGNHEFDYSQEIFGQRMNDAKFDFICANITVSNGSFPQPKPYKIFNFNGYKIAVLGLVHTGKNTGIPDAHPAKLKGLEFEDGIEAAKKYRFLKDSADILIALSHLGYSRDAKLASEMKELDVIISGHSHQKVASSNEINNVFIAQAGAYLEYLGMLSIKVKNGKIIEKTETLIDLQNERKTVHKIDSIVEAYNHNPSLNKPITIANEDIIGNDALGILMTDAIKSELKTDIAFQNNGGIRIDKLGKGEITIKDVYRLDPFNNDIYIFNLTEDEIKALFKESVSKGHKLYLQVSGITFKVTGEDNPTVEITDLNNNPLQKKTYSVALNSYIASTYKTLANKEGKNTYMQSASLIIGYLKKQKSIRSNKSIRAIY
mgnify:CR=1 FL=1